MYTNLIDYLAKVLEIVSKKENQEKLKPQKLLLCTWIVELKLNEINDLLSKMEDENLRPIEKAHINDQYQTKLITFNSFLSKHKQDVNEETIFQVLQSHGRINECIEYAEMIERYDTVIVHYINK